MLAVLMDAMKVISLPLKNGEEKKNALTLISRESKKVTKGGDRIQKNGSVSHAYRRMQTIAPMPGVTLKMTF